MERHNRRTRRSSGNIVELYASGRRPGELAKEFGRSEASVHAWVKQAGMLRPLPYAGSAVKIVRRQAYQVAAVLRNSYCF